MRADFVTPDHSLQRTREEAARDAELGRTASTLFDDGEPKLETEFVRTPTVVVVE